MCSGWREKADGERARGLMDGLLTDFLGNFYVAAAGSVPDGLANGNVLHFVLAAVYVRTRVPGRFSRLVGTSLALSLVGCAIGPWTPALAPSSLAFSFAAALVVLALTAAYLAVFIPSGVFASRSRGGGDAPPYTTTTRRKAVASAMVSPFYYLYAESAVRLPALALLLHHTAQGFLFVAIVVHAVVDLGFYEIQNGLLFGLESAVPAVYLMLALYGVPRLQKMWKKRARSSIPDDDDDDDDDDAARETGSGRDRRRGGSGEVARRRRRAPSTRDFACAIICMLAQLAALPWFLAVTAQSRGAVYGLVAVASVGPAAPPFLKSYAVSVAGAPVSALGTLALMESVGALAAPLLLAGFRLGLWRDAVVVWAPSLVGAAALCLVGSYLVARRSVARA